MESLGRSPRFPTQEMSDSTPKIFTTLFINFRDRRHGDVLNDAVCAVLKTIICDDSNVVICCYDRHCNIRPCQRTWGGVSNRYCGYMVLFT